MVAEIDIAIIGAGVIGLATAREIAQGGQRVFIFEKNRTFGLETNRLRLISQWSSPPTKW